MKEILPGIHTWSVFSHDKKIDFNGHLVSNEEGCVLIDPPPMSDEDLARAESIGPPQCILVTNCHHTRDAAALARRWRVPIFIGEPDADLVPPTVRLGGVFRDGDRLAAGLVAIALDHQKSPGETALLRREAGAVILGDALIGRPAGQLALLPADKYADPRKTRESLRRLLEHPFDAVLVGDGASLPAGGRAVLERFLAGP